MSELNASVKEEVVLPEDSNEVEWELDYAPENAERMATRDESSTGQLILPGILSMGGVSSGDGSLTTAPEQSSNFGEGSNANADGNPGASENGAAAATAPSPASLGRAVNNFAPRLAGAVPPQEGRFPPFPAQSNLLPHLLQAQASRMSLNESLLNQLSSVVPPSASAQLPHMPQVQTPQLDLPSLLNQISSIPPLQQFAGYPHQPAQGTPHMSFMSPSLQALLGQLGLTSLAQLGLASLTQNAGLPHIPQAQTVPSLHTSVLGQLDAARSNQNSYFLPSPALTNLNSTTASLLQRLSASLNPSLPPIPQAQSQNLQHLIRENMVKDEIIAYLVLSSQQRTGNPTSNINNINAQTAAFAGNSQLPSRTTDATSNLEDAHQDQNPAAASAHLPQRVARSEPSAAEETTAKSSVASRRCNNVPDECECKEKRWMMRYDELKGFQQEHGHCRVPHGYSQNRKLSWWVMNQRAQYQLLKQGKKSWMSQDRVELLDAIGFDWNPLVRRPAESK